MKKLISAGASLLMILLVLSCGNKGPAEEKTAEETPATQNIVVIAMGSGFSTLDPGYVYEQNPPWLSMPVTKLCSNSTMETMPPSPVLPNRSAFPMTVRCCR